MTTWIDRIQFPEAWIDLRRVGDRFSRRRLVASHRKELRREIAPGHVLHDLRWQIIGLGVPARDDALLRVDDGRVALVHVTWRGAPEPPSWPTTTFVSSQEEFNDELRDRGWEFD